MNRGRIDAWQDRMAQFIDHLNGDHVVRLGDTQGVNAQSVLDAQGVERAWIDSKGAAMFHGLHGHIAAVAVDRLVVPLAHGVLLEPLHATDTRMNFGELAHTLAEDTFVMLYTGDGITEYVLTGAPIVTKMLPGLPWIPLAAQPVTRDITRDLAGTGALEWATGTPYMVFGTEGEHWIEFSSVEDVRFDLFTQGLSRCDCQNLIHMGKMYGLWGVEDEAAIGMGVGDYAAHKYWRFDTVNGLVIKADQICVGAVDEEPTSPMQVGGIVEYADNAAAVAAGLTEGAFYRTGDVLKVVHA